MTLSRPHVILVLLPALMACSSMACSSGLTRPVAASLEAPSQVEFAPTYVAGSRELVVSLRAFAATTLPVDLAIDGPFEAEPMALSLTPGELTELRLRFRPVATGPAAGHLLLAFNGDVTTVELAGVGLAWLPCASNDPCTRRRFDPDAGFCLVEWSAPEGTGCETPCFAEGSCRGGLCDGRRRDCDDGNDCTNDACDEDTGCVHLDATRERCPAPDDPCLAAVCDHVTGCGEAPAPDDTACGVPDCSVTPRCRAGACVLAPTPEGAICPATPCQDEGVCRAGVCDRPPARVLEPEWSYLPAMGKHAIFEGVASDVDGWLFWTECDLNNKPSQCDLVSFTNTGHERWRTSLPGDLHCTGTASGHLLLSQNLLVSAETDNFVEARRPSDGSLVWSIDLLNVVSGGQLATWMLDRRYLGVGVGPLVDNGHGLIYVQVQGKPMCGQKQPIIDGLWLVALARNTGEVRWIKSLDGNDFWGSMVGDEQGNVFFVTHVDPTPPAIYSPSTTWTQGVAADGQALWRRDGYRSIMAVTRDRLFTWMWAEGYYGPNACLLDAATGDDLVDVALQDSSSGKYNQSPVLGRIGVTQATICQNGACPPRVANHVIVNGFDIETGGVLWTFDYDPGDHGGGTSQPTLTDRGTVLFLSISDPNAKPWSFTAWTATLREVTLDGREVVTCLGSDDLWKNIYLDGSALVMGHLILGSTSGIGVNSLWIGAPEIARRGWTMRSGGLGRTSQPK